MDAKVQEAVQRIESIELFMKNLEEKSIPETLNQVLEKLAGVTDQVMLIKKAQIAMAHAEKKESKSRFNDKRAKDMIPTACKVDNSNFQEFSNNLSIVSH